MVINIFWLFTVSICYLTLFVFIPFWLRGFKFSGENVMDNLVSSFLYGHVIIILAACFLSLIGIYYWFTFTLLLIVIAIGCCFIAKRQQMLKILNIKQFVFDYADGYYPIRVLVRLMIRRQKAFIMNVIHKINNPIGFLFTMGIFSYGIYTRSYHAVVNMFYGTSDMYLHTEWIKYFMNNEPYMAGVYPFGFHSIIAAVSSVFHIDVVTVMRMIGPISGMMIFFSLYYIMKKSMHSTFAVNAALALYVVTDMFPFWATERQFLALPQEVGTIFLYLTGYFLYKYIKEKKNKDLIHFSLAVSLTLLIHFFVTICAVFICAAVFFFGIIRLDKKIFIRLIAGVLCSLFIAVMPLCMGLVKGIEFNGSLEWALSFFMGSGDEDEDEVEDEEGIDDEKVRGNTKMSDIYETLKSEGYFKKDYNLSLLNAYWFIPYLIGAMAGFIAPFIKRKGRERRWLLMACSGYSLLLCFLFILSAADIFSIMEYSRIYAFFIYSVPLVICTPFELIYLILCETKKALHVIYILLITTVTGMGSYFIGAHQRFMPLGRVWQSQYNGAVIAYYNIVKQFPKNNWIIVSSMSEYTLCLMNGYHYQMVKFIMEIDDYHEDSRLYLPAENVFFYVVKRPNTYLDTDLQYLGNIEALPEFDEQAALIDLKKEYKIYKDENLLEAYRNFDANHVLQAKAHAWAKEYRKYFPKEMTIFYEDDEIIVYRIKQNPYALNNFAIKYIGN